MAYNLATSQAGYESAEVSVMIHEDSIREPSIHDQQLADAKKDSISISIPTSLSSSEETHENHAKQSGGKNESVTKKSKDTDPEKEKKPRVGFTDLYRYADNADLALLYLGIFGAIMNGGSRPVFAVLFAGIIGSYNSANIESSVMLYVYLFIGIGSAIWVAGVLEVGCLMSTAERVTARVRHLYLRSLMSQDQAWLDAHPSSELMHNMTTDTRNFSEAIGDKLGSFIRFMSTFVSGIIIGFAYSWRLALIVVAVMPLLAGSAATMGYFVRGQTKSLQTSYSAAGTIAQESITNIKTVAAFGLERIMVDLYQKHLVDARKIGIRSGVTKGSAFGITMLIIYSSYALCLWYAATLVYHGTETGTQMVTTFFAVLMGAFSLGQAMPQLPLIEAGRVSAFTLFETIERKSKIDALAPSGRILSDVKGDWLLQGVTFSFPSRPKTPVLVNFSLGISPGEVVALVGESGAGKSTVTSLLQRMYDPDDGTVSLDGVNFCDLNVHWLRSMISTVSQEPVLFSRSILENVRLGKPDATETEVKAAIIAASASFVFDLPDSWHTKVGEGGGMLSGGQKQRIALARAFVTNPRLIILDESTAALDQATEALVQSAIMNFISLRHCSVLTVAHRLSSIRNADRIVVMERGVIVESGTHDALMEKRNMYYNLFHAQVAAAGSSLSPTSSQDLTKDDNNEKFPTPGSSSPRTTSKHSTDVISLSDSASKDEKAKIPLKNAPLRRVFMMARPEWNWLFFGIFGALLVGASFPALSQLLSRMITVFYLPRDEIISHSTIYASIFVAVGVAIGSSHFVQAWALSIAGESLTARLRSDSFLKILSMHIGWHEEPEHNSGLLCSGLQDDAARVNGLTNGPIQTGGQLVSLFSAALGIAFFYEPELAAIIIAMSPILLGASHLQMKFMVGYSDAAKEAIQAAAQNANEAIVNARTVASYNGQQLVLDGLDKQINMNRKRTYRASFVNGNFLGMSQFSLYCANALSFWVGARLIEQGKTGFINVISVFLAISMASIGASQASNLGPDIRKSAAAAIDAFKLLDSHSLIDPLDDSGEEPNQPNLSHTAQSVDVPSDFSPVNVEFRDLHFTYASRPDAPIFNGFSLFVPAGTTIAIVGQSGSGKSSLISLLLRFYNPTSGQILIDGQDISRLKLQRLRMMLGFIQQEPKIFTQSIRANIRFGAPGASDAEVELAARDANAHDFIMKLPEQYDTICSSNTLSGGQKQRIAIARCLVRRCRVLLADEITSALDSVSEKQVTETLQRISKRCTTFIVAHRLATIRSCDLIACVDHGTLKELGSHDALVEQRGVYYRLLQANNAAAAAVMDNTS